MNTKNMIIRAVLIVLCMAFTGGIIYLLVTIENEKAMLQAEMRKLAVSKKGLASVVTYLEESNASLETKLKDSDRKAYEITSRYEEEKSKNEASIRQIEEKDGQIKEKEAGIEKHKEETKQMTRRVKLLSAAFNEIKVEYDQLDNEKSELEEELEDQGRIIKDLSRKDSTPLGTVIIR